MSNGSFEFHFVRKKDHLTIFNSNVKEIPMKYQKQLEEIPKKDQCW